MKKKVISIILMGIMVHSVYACGSIASKEADHDEVDESLHEESSESGTVQEKEVSEKTEDIRENNEVQQTEDDKSAEPIYTIEPGLTQDDTYEMQDWQAAYAEYIEGLEWNRDCTYSLIYVDDDDIPELVIDSGFEAGGCEILTYHSGEIDVLQTDRRLFYYIEKQNLFNNTGGLMGYYFDRIYSIENGEWVCVADGERTEMMGEDDWVFRYEWDGEEVEEDVYTQSLNAVFDMEQKIEPDLYYIMDEMLALFKTGDVASQKHRYELFVEDVTWDEARSRCEERGGYLATITSPEEYERIQKGILDGCQTDIAFWVGASDNDDVLGQKIFGFGWLEPNKAPDDYCMLDHFNALFIFWKPNGPSYGDFAYLMYDDTEERCNLYDAPMDILSVYPECEGKIGYICEYDSVTVMAKETWFYPDDDSRWYEYEYDGAGNLTKEIYYNADGGINWWWENEYDSAGNQAKCICYNADGDIKYWYEWKYDSAGNETKWVEHRYDGSVRKWREYEYDSAGNMIKDTVHEPNINFEYIYEYEYDDAGNQTKESYYTNGSLMYWDEYEYDSTGNNVKDTMYNDDGSVRYIHEFEYDSRGNKTKKTTTYYPEDGRDTEYEWEYDNMGNLTRSKYVEYWWGELCDWAECEYEYITITPRNEATVSNLGLFH